MANAKMFKVGLKTALEDKCNKSFIVAIHSFSGDNRYLNIIEQFASLGWVPNKKHGTVLLAELGEIVPAANSPWSIRESLVLDGFVRGCLTKDLFTYDNDIITAGNKILIDDSDDTISMARLVWNYFGASGIELVPSDEYKKAKEQNTAWFL